MNPVKKNNTTNKQTPNEIIFSGVKKNAKKLIGTVVSDKMDKTCVVEIVEQRSHSIYQRTFSVSRKIKAHDEKNEYHAGDIVEITETKPLSKTKAWTITRKNK